MKEEKSVFDLIKTEIDKGREGLNVGFTMGLPKLESIIDGVTASTYTLIISSSGSGKSSFYLYSYIYKPLMEHLEDNNFKALIVTLEMSPVSLYIKLLSIYIFEKYGKILSYKDLLSRRKGHTLDDKDYDLVMDCEEWINKIDEHIEFYDKNVNAKSLYALLCDRLEKYGTFSETETRKTYKADNPNMTYLVVIDHIGLVKPQTGHSLKMEIDLISSYLVTLREMCGISPVVIQQTNRDHASSERLRANRIAFTMNDAKDSGNTVNDCNIMLAIFDPYKDGLRTYHGYNIEAMQGMYRSCLVLKNRFGDCDVEVGLNFFGNINYFKELPLPDQIIDYTRYRTPDYITPQLQLD